MLSTTAPANNGGGDAADEANIYLKQEMMRMRCSQQGAFGKGL
jgi:hypothetical protein